jgi:hypothetical protein
MFVQRLAGTEADSIGVFLNRLSFVAKSEVSTGVSGPALKSRLRSVMSGLHTTATENLLDVATYEAKFSSKLFSKYYNTDIKSPGESTLKKAIVSTNMSINNVHTHGTAVLKVNESAPSKSIATAYKQFGQRKADDIHQVIRDSQIKGLTIAETHAAIDERVAGLLTSQARTLAATAINYTTNIAKSQVIQENRDIIAQEQWVSTLETNTCDYCEGNSDQVYDQGEAPDCPAHWNCNCEVIPYVG